MNDLIPIAVFVGCLLATLGLVRVCEWLRPASSTPQPDAAVGRGGARASTDLSKEGAR